MTHVRRPPYGQRPRPRRTLPSGSTPHAGIQSGPRGLALVPCPRRGLEDIPWNV